MFSKCIISNATITGFLFLEFLRNLKTKFVFCISHHGYHVGLETVFWMADVDEMAQVRGSWEKLPSCQSGKVSCFKETKRFPLVFLLLIKSYKKNGFEKKIICHPTHHDITSYQDIRVHIPVWQEKHSLLHSTFKEMMCFSRVGSLIEAVLRLCSWAEAKSYCTALPEPWNQMGLWSPRSTELSGNLYLS